MAYSNQFRPKIEQPKAYNSALEYKDHNEFFVKFYELRTKLVFNLSKQALEYDKKGMRELYVALVDLVEWTSDYINCTEIDKKLDIIDVEITRVSKLPDNYNGDLLGKIYKKIKSVWREVSLQHNKNELIPRVQVNLEEEDPYKDEENAAKKLMKKVVHKMFENV